MVFPQLVTRRDVEVSRAGFSLNFAAGSLRLRLAETDEELAAAQRLRYRVFYEEMGATPTPRTALTGIDEDEYDEVADHLIVTDRCAPGLREYVVGTYRLIRRGAAARRGGFYSAQEFDIDKLAAHTGEILELGRSCVDRDYRSMRVIDLLWQGVAAYLCHYRIGLLFGCASFHGADPEALAGELSYLYHYCRAPEDIRPRALRHRFVEMNRRPAEEIDPREGFAMMPPLLKGYLRLGGVVGDGAVVDRQFGTTDVCIVVPQGPRIERYIQRYQARWHALKAR